MSPSSLESQIAEHPDTQPTEMHDQDSFGRLAMSSSDFSALEERIARTITLDQNRTPGPRRCRAAEPKHSMLNSANSLRLSNPCRKKCAP